MRLRKDKEEILQENFAALRAEFSGVFTECAYEKLLFLKILWSRIKQSLVWAILRSTEDTVRIERYIIHNGDILAAKADFRDLKLPRIELFSPSYYA